MTTVEENEQRKAAEYHLNQSKLAAQLASDPMLKDILQARKEQLFSDFCGTKPDQSEEREHIHRQMQEHYEFESALMTRIQVGVIAQDEINHLNNDDEII